MRKLRLVLCLAVLVGVLPVGAVGALGLVEGDPSWDCRKMGNGVCGDAGPALLEGAPGWDCLTMGNGSCGAEPAALDASNVIAPRYTSTFRKDFCDEVLVMCETKSSASLRTGALKVSAGALGPGLPPCDPHAVDCEFTRGKAYAERFLNARHVVDGSVPSLTYTMSMDIEKSQNISDPLRTLALEDSYVLFRASSNLLQEDPVRCSAPLQRGSLPLGHEPAGPDAPAYRLPIDPAPGTLVLKTTLTCRDRSTFPSTQVDVPDGHEIDVHISAVAWAQPEESLLGTGDPTPLGVAHASFEASRTTITAS